MLYGLAAFTDLLSISDPNDFTNYVSQGGAADVAAANASTGPIPVATVPTVASTTQPAAQPTSTTSSEWPVLLLVAAGAAYWFWGRKKHA